MAVHKGPHPKKQAFLTAFGIVASISKAAEMAGIDRSNHYDWMREDPEYPKAFETAQQQAAASLEDEAVRRAYHGIDKPVTIAGNREVITEYSDTLLIFLMKGAMPTKYRENWNIRHEASEDLASILRQRFAKNADSPTEP